MKTNRDDKEWAARLEAGGEDDALLQLAAQLRQAGEETHAAPTVEFQRQLRRDLLNQYPARPRRSASFWRWAGSAAVVSLLALAVVSLWFSMSSAGRSSFGGADLSNGAPIPTAPVTAAILGGWSVSTLPAAQESQPSTTLEIITIWQIPDPLIEARPFAQVRNEAGETVAQAEGQLISASGMQDATLVVTLPDALPEGRYHVVLGLYDLAGARMPLYDSITMSVIFEHMASELTVGENGMVEEVVSGIGPAATALPPDGSSRTYLGYSISGGLVIESMQTDGGDIQTQSMMVPGVDVEVVVRWGLPPASKARPFIHLLDNQGQPVAQSDGPLLAAAPNGQPVAATLLLSLPVDLVSGRYELVAGLYDQTTGARLPITTSQGEVTVVSLDQYDVTGRSATPEFDIVLPENAPQNGPGATVLPSNPSTSGSAITTIGNLVTVLDVSPAVGTILTGTQPITFTVRLAYDAVSPPALLEVKVITTEGENGRGVATAQAALESESGEITVPVVLHPAQEFNAPTKLGLLLQLRADAAAPPSWIDLPVGYHWRYTP